MKPILVIPSAKYIPAELQSVGKIPPILYPLGSGTLYDYLSVLYKKNLGTTRIVGYEGFEHLQKRFTGKDEIELIKLDILTDLAHTVYKGLNDTDGEVILNFADTFIDEDVTDSMKDCFYYSEENISDLWTFFTLKDGNLDNILDKPKTHSHEMGMLFTGVFRFSDGGYLKKCLAQSISSPVGNISTFYSSILRYNSRHPLKPVRTDKWYDIGHLDRYYNSKLEVDAREFNHISIDKNRGILRKTSDDKEKFIGEIQWYLKLPSDVEYCRPRIFSYSTSYDNPYVEMEYYSYHTIHELFLYGELRYDQWRTVFERIAFVMRDMSRYTVKDDVVVKSLREMYLDKTISRLEKMSFMPEFQKFIDQPVIVNGVRYLPLNKITGILKTEIERRLCSINELSIIHGDLCFTNILIDGSYSFVKLIDPRGKFGHFDIYGDRRYDLAKLFHSVDGKYDYIIKNKFKITYGEKNNVIELSFDDDHNGLDLYGLLQYVFSDMIGDQKDNIELIESLLFLSMIPLHNENRDHQMAMLATGLRILDRTCHIREE